MATSWPILVSPERVEDLVAPLDALEPHPAGDGVHRIVPPDVLDEREDLGALGERATVNRARLLVDRLVLAHGVEQGEERFLGDSHVLVKVDRLDVGHEVAEDRSLPAAGGRGALLRLGPEIGEPVARGHRDGTDFPVDLHRDDLLDGIDQPLVAQEPDREGLGRGAQAHHGEDFLLVDVEREGMLAGDRRGDDRALLVQRVDGISRGTRLLGEDGTVAQASNPR